MLTSLYYGFWDYWELYHKVTFDGENRLIIINEGETIIDVQTDIYSNWKEWISLEENTKYTQALTTVGGEPTIAGQRLDVTYFLINGWKIKPYPGSYDLNIIGNIFDSEGGSIKIPADINPLFPNNISITTNTSVIVRQVTSNGGSTTGSTLTQEQNDALFNIEGRVIAIQNTLNQPLTTSLVTPQLESLLNIESKLIELWKIHGLDVSNPLVVNQNKRIAGNIDQDIVTTGENITQQTIITRNP